MQTSLTILALLQAAGAIVGAGGSVFAEIFYVRAMRDGRIDQAERDHLRVIGKTLRVGMMLLLLSSIGLTLVDFAYDLSPQPALTSAYWTELLLALLIIASTWATARLHLSFVIGSSIIFTAWWYIAFLTLGRLPPMSFGASIALYVVATTIIAGVLTYARILTKQA